MFVWSLFAQAGPMPPQPTAGLWIFMLIGLLISALAMLYSGFWLWMLIDCILREPDRFFWIWLLVIAPFPGAIVYAVARFFPQRDFTAPQWMRAWTRGKELARLETAAHQIGNAHQFLQWGDALREVGRWDQAKAAYEQALLKDPQSLPALWGAALVAVQQKHPADVKNFCQRILAVDPQYKFGDVSLAYGRGLQDLGDAAAARQHFEQHVKRWRHPEAVYLLACECRDAGDIDAAREHIKSMLRDIHGSPTAIARKFGRWKSRGQKLLRQLR
ncbi:tetratricopeptide repeat protein [bacterium]|nr:tetratricopeptide repeat protein [bacterium]